MKKSKIAQRVANTENMPSYDELFVLVADLDAAGYRMNEHDVNVELGCGIDIARQYVEILRNIRSIVGDNNLWNDIESGTFLG